MKTFYRGLAVAFIHILIVLSLGGKLLYDRATCPRVWVRTGSIDPEMPIRGKYLTLNLEVRAPEFKQLQPSNPPIAYDPGYVTLTVENDQLVAHKTDRPTEVRINTWNQQHSRGEGLFLLSSPVDFFIPEHAEVFRNPQTELWVQVTVPKKGPPRPIQLAIKRGNELTPLVFR